MPLWKLQPVNIQTVLCIVCRGRSSLPCNHMKGIFPTAKATKSMIQYYKHERDFESDAYLARWVLFTYVNEMHVYNRLRCEEEAYNKRYASSRDGLRSNGISDELETNIGSSLSPEEALNLSSWAFSGC